MDAAKKLIDQNIYPSIDEFRVAAEEGFRKNDPEFFENVGSKRWNKYYDKNIRKIVRVTLYIFINQ